MAKYLALLITILITHRASCQVTVSSLVLSTGYNPITGAAVIPAPNGGTPVPDPHWKVSAISPDIITTMTAMPVPGVIIVTAGNAANVITPFPGPWVQNPSGNPGQWIYCMNTNTPNDMGTGTTDYSSTFARPFKMCSDDTVTFTLHFTCDNYFSAADIDGVPLSIPAASTWNEAFYSYVAVTKTVFLTAGLHTIHATTVNFNTSQPGTNPAGFNMYGTVVSTRGRKSFLSESSFSSITRDSICSGNALKIHANLDSTFFNWTVSPGGSSIGSLNCITCIGPTATPAQTTQYIAASTADSACNDTTLVTVLPAANKRIDTSLCFNIPAQLNIPVSGTALQSITWTPALYLNNNTIINPLCTPLADITYLVAIAYNGTLQCSGTDTVHVTVRPNPVVNAGNDQFICTDTFVLKATSNNNNLSYAWTPAAGLNAPGEATTIGALQGSTQAYIVNVTDIQTTCKGADTVTINNYSLKAAFTLSKDSLCLGDTLSLINNSTGSTPSYVWNLGDGDTTTQTDLQHVYAKGDRYIIQLTASNQYCKDSTMDTVYVFAPPIGRILLHLSDSIICMGGSVVVGATVPAGYSYIAWDFGNGYQQQNSTSFRKSYDKEGIYTIKIKGSYTACPDLDTSVTLSVITAPIVNIGLDTGICPGDAGIVLSNMHSQNGTYRNKWSTGETSETITVNHPGTYYLTVFTGDGCATTDTVEVRPNCYMAIPNAFSPNGDDVNDYFFPRQILARGVKGFHMQIYNRWGEMLYETNSTDGRGWDGQFNGQPQPQSVYVYLIEVTYINGVSEKYKGNVTLLR